MFHLELHHDKYISIVQKSKQLLDNTDPSYIITSQVRVSCSCCVHVHVLFCNTQQDKLNYRKGLKGKEKLRQAHIEIYFSKGQTNSQGCL